MLITEVCMCVIWKACRDRPLRLLGMARVLKRAQVYLLSPHSSANGMNHTCLFLPSQSWSSFIDPRGMEGWVGLSGWLHTQINIRYQDLNLDMVTHPSTNRAWRRLTSLIETNVLLLCQTTTERWNKFLMNLDSMLKNERLILKCKGITFVGCICSFFSLLSICLTSELWKETEQQWLIMFKVQLTLQ